MKSVDYIVVGQGIAGTLLAHDLIEQGKKVVVIDTDKKASASKVAAGLFNPVSMKRCIPTWNASSFLPFAIERYQQLQKKLSCNFLKLTPVLKVFSNNEVAQQWKVQYSNTNIDAYISGFNSNNTFSYLKDGSGSAKIEPAGSLDVKKFLSVSKQYFKSTDSFLDQEFDYNQFNPQKGIYKDICAEKIIFCEGFRVLENPFFKFLPLRPTKGEVITIRIPSLKRLDYILSAGIYLVCLRDYEYIVGATYTHQHMDDLVSEQGTNHLVSSLNKLLDVEFELIEAKAGVRPTVFDRKPLLGLHPNLTKLAVFNGLGTRGILIAPLLSAHLSTNLTQSTNSGLATDNERVKSFY